MPLRPGKFRLNVRTETLPVGGAWPMPTHGPQAGSSIRAPLAIIAWYAPPSASASRICFEPGVTVMKTSGCAVLPFMTAATIARSA